MKRIQAIFILSILAGPAMAEDIQSAPAPPPSGGAAAYDPIDPSTTVPLTLAEIKALIDSSVAQDRARLVYEKIRQATAVKREK